MFITGEFNQARIGTTMPLVYLGTGWFIGIALASALHLPIEFLLLTFLVPIVGFCL